MNSWKNELESKTLDEGVVDERALGTTMEGASPRKSSSIHGASGMDWSSSSSSMNWSSSSSSMDWSSSSSSSPSSFGSSSFGSSSKGVSEGLGQASGVMTGTTQRGVGGSDGSMAKFDIGTLLKNRYRVERLIGKGGFGLVYEASDLQEYNRRVAIKTLKHNLDDYEMAARRFKREIELCQSIIDSHAVKIYDDGIADDGTLYYVMEYLEGCGLDTLIEKREKFTFRETKSILVQVLSALAEAHDKKIIHRDLKPANIWLTEKTVDNMRAFDVKVLDFGIAKALDKNAGEEKLTQTGTWMGSPAYMSPEQLTGREVTVSSDIFAIGLIAIEMITNRPAVEGDTPMDIAMEIIGANEIYLEEWIAETSFGEVLTKCVQKSPSARYRNAGELYDIFAAMDDDELRNEYNEAKLHRKTRTRASAAALAMSDTMGGAQTSVAGMATIESLQSVQKENQIQMLLFMGIVLILVLLIGVGAFLGISAIVNAESEAEKPSSEEEGVAKFSPLEQGLLKSISYGSFGAYEQFRGVVSITTAPNGVKVYRVTPKKVEQAEDTGDAEANAADVAEGQVDSNEELVLLGTTPLNLSLIWARYNDANAKPFHIRFQAEGYKDLDFAMPINNMTTSHHITLERGRGQRRGMGGRGPEGLAGADAKSKSDDDKQASAKDLAAQAKKNTEETQKKQAEAAAAKRAASAESKRKQAEETTAKNKAAAEAAKAKRESEKKEAEKRVRAAVSSRNNAKSTSQKRTDNSAQKKSSGWSVDGL